MRYIGRALKQCFLVLAAVIVTVGVSVRAPAANGPASSSAPSPSYPAACDTADLAQIAKSVILQGSPSDVRGFLQQRIAACKSLIAAYLVNLPPPPPNIAHNPPGLPPLPTPDPLTTAPPGCSVPKPGTRGIVSRGVVYK